MDVATNNLIENGNAEKEVCMAFEKESSYKTGREAYCVSIASLSYSTTCLFTKFVRSAFFRIIY